MKGALEYRAGEHIHLHSVGDLSFLLLPLNTAVKSDDTETRFLFSKGLILIPDLVRKFASRAQNEGNGAVEAFQTARLRVDVHNAGN